MAAMQALVVCCPARIRSRAPSPAPRAPTLTILREHSILRQSIWRISFRLQPGLALKLKPAPVVRRHEQNLASQIGNCARSLASRIEPGKRAVPPQACRADSPCDSKEADSVLDLQYGCARANFTAAERSRWKSNRRAAIMFQRAPLRVERGRRGKHEL